MDVERTEAGDIQSWTPDEVAGAFFRGEIVLIDVRTPQEYVFEHIAGALLLPMPYFKSQYLPFATDKQIVLYCGEGLRALLQRCAERRGFPLPGRSRPAGSVTVIPSAV